MVVPLEQDGKFSVPEAVAEYLQPPSVDNTRRGDMNDATPAVRKVLSSAKKTYDAGLMTIISFRCSLT